MVFFFFLQKHCATWASQRGSVWIEPCHFKGANRHFSRGGGSGGRKVRGKKEKLWIIEGRTRVDGLYASQALIKRFWRKSHTHRQCYWEIASCKTFFFKKKKTTWFLLFRPFLLQKCTREFKSTPCVPPTEVALLWRQWGATCRKPDVPKIDVHNSEAISLACWFRKCVQSTSI